jgi:hypothetical protein
MMNCVVATVVICLKTPIMQKYDELQVVVAVQNYN